MYAARHTEFGLEESAMDKQDFDTAYGAIAVDSPPLSHTPPVARELDGAVAVLTMQHPPHNLLGVALTDALMPSSTRPRSPPVGCATPRTSKRPSGHAHGAPLAMSPIAPGGPSPFRPLHGISATAINPHRLSCLPVRGSTTARSSPNSVTAARKSSPCARRWRSSNLGVTCARRRRRAARWPWVRPWRSTMSEAFVLAGGA